jgi:glutamate synthase (NADPH/NADH) small chain
VYNFTKLSRKAGMLEIKREIPKVDRKERMKLAYHPLEARPARERVQDFEDVVIALDAERAVYEATRCIHCPDPAPCFKACPAGNDISFALYLIEQGKFLEAAHVYRDTSSLPEICGRVCPHDQLCQGACVRSKRGEPVLTGALEVFVSDYQRQHSDVLIPVGQSTGKRVAVVGAGPSGLSCAEQLVQQGHHATIFDAHLAPGGLLIYGIPNFKLPKKVVFDRWADLEAVGVEFIPDTFIGVDKTIDTLFEEGFDAVYIGVGALIDAPMNVPGEDLPDVWKATEFLIRANVDRQLLPESMQVPPEIGEKVVVIGGGDTASDCLRTALRMGAKEVTCLYRRTENEMPGNSHDRQLAGEEGAQYQFLTQPVRFIAGEDGHLAIVECIRMQLGEPDASGRQRPVPIEGTNFMVPADTAILALGYWPDETIGNTTPGLETHKWGLIVSDAQTRATSRPGVYAGGDAVTGPDLVVTAMVAGRRAAAAIDDYLQSS